jgi:hypothetical protein
MHRMRGYVLMRHAGFACLRAPHAEPIEAYYKPLSCDQLSFDKRFSSLETITCRTVRLSLMNPSDAEIQDKRIARWKHAAAADAQQQCDRLLRQQMLHH